MEAAQLILNRYYTYQRQGVIKDSQCAVNGDTS